jgi:asparagine synthase (glutamine-hydrolysing)
MCSIVGLIDKRSKNVSSRLKQMLELTEHRGPDGSGIAIGTSCKRADALEDIDVKALKGSSGIGHSRLRITGESGIQPLCDCTERFILAFNGEIWNYKEIRKDLIRNGHFFITDSDGEVIVHLVEEAMKGSDSLLEVVSETYRELDGEFAFVVFDSKENVFVLARDHVGIKQLYYGENDDYIGFCSEKKPLWNLGLDTIRVLPGELIEMKPESSNAFSIRKNIENVLVKNDVSITEEMEALKTYKTSLYDAVEKRVRGQDRIGIIFSGGVDSVVIAQIVQLLGKDVICYTSGFAESTDVINSRKVAEDVGFILRVNELSEEKIDAELPKIITAIESSNHLQVDVAIPIYFAVKLAKEDGVRVMLTGQGADELFAGYPWYPKVLEEKGDIELVNSLWNDIKHLYKDTLEREDKITMYHSIELRIPYLDPTVIKSSMAVSTDLKIRNNTLKYLHRKLANEVGLPDYISWRPKEAAQHGSNVHDALKKVISKRKELLKDSPEDDLIIKKRPQEELGSAYRYSSHKVYAEDEENRGIQYVLDRIGVEAGIF